MPVRNGNLGNDRTTTTKAASVRKQLVTTNSKSNYKGRQENNGGVKGRTGVQRSLTERLVRITLQLAGHVERMAADRLPKRAAELREEGRRRRGRPRLRWEDCVERDVQKAGEEEDWKKTRDGGGWKRLSDEEVAGSTSHQPKEKKEEIEIALFYHLLAIMKCFSEVQCLSAPSCSGHSLRARNSW